VNAALHCAGRQNGYSIFETAPGGTDRELSQLAANSIGAAAADWDNPRSGLSRTLPEGWPGSTVAGLNFLDVGRVEWLAIFSLSANEVGGAGRGGVEF